MTDRPAWMTARGTPWRRGHERVVFETAWIAVTEQTAIAPTGRPAPYGMVAFKNLAIAILPLHADGTVPLVGQHRLPLGDYSWEIPEGGSPLGVDPLEGAKRELLEETGLVAAEWREVMRLQLSNSITDERAVGFIATGLMPAPGGARPDDTEEIALARVPFREVLDAVVGGHLTDALTVALVLRAYHMAREGALPGELARVMLN